MKKPQLVKALVRARLAEITSKERSRRAPSRKAAVTDRVTDDAVRQATGRDWKGWIGALDKAGARELSHKQLVANLGAEVESSWWRQSIAVAYEQAHGKRVVGETAGTGFQIGVQRTLPLSATEAWELVTEQPDRWLGAGAKVEFEPGQAYEVSKRRGVPGGRGQVRLASP